MERSNLTHDSGSYAVLCPSSMRINGIDSHDHLGLST